MTSVTLFPFDQFGGAGTSAGAQLLGDVIGEILYDTDEETRPCRADCLRGEVAIQEFAFDTMAKLANWRQTGRAAARKTIDACDFLLWLGGNHLSVLPVMDELGRETLVVQFDAHLDVYSFHDTTTELSHGNYLKHVETPRPRFINVGHRDLFLAAKEVAATFDAVHSAVEVATEPDRIVRDLRKRVRGAKRVWIDVDCDVFDPAALPAVQQPLPFGLMPAAFLQLFEAVWSERVVGLSISEFDPGRDARDRSLGLLGWFLEFVLLKVNEGR